MKKIGEDKLGKLNCSYINELLLSICTSLAKDTLSEKALYWSQAEPQANKIQNLFRESPVDERFSPHGTATCIHVCLWRGDNSASLGQQRQF